MGDGWEVVLRVDALHGQVGLRLLALIGSLGELRR